MLFPAFQCSPPLHLSKSNANVLQQITAQAWQLKTIRISLFTVLVSGSPKSRHWWDWRPPKSSKKYPFLMLLVFRHLFVFRLSQLLPGFLGLWPHLSSLSLHRHVAFSAMYVSESCFSHGIQPLTSLPLTQAVIILFSFLPPALPPFLPSSKCIYHVSSFLLGDHEQPKQAESAL